MTSTTIALDAMGGDYGMDVVIPAALKMLAKEPNLNIIFVGDEHAIKAKLRKASANLLKRVKICHASEVVSMDEPPAQALRTKKDSSMRVAINLVKDGTANACVSAGNTGALMATAKFVLKTLPGIDRPAICALIPTLQSDHSVRLLDLGANVDSNADLLFQFAVMGSVLAQAVSNITAPKVGLLNIGEEDIKGTEQVKEAARRLAECADINYIGYIEGDDIYKGVADVIVCDGFVGNVALKTSEGLAKLIMRYVRDSFKESWLSRLAALIAWPVLKKVSKRLDPSRYNGATFAGLQGIVIKSHGSTNVKGFENAIRQAILQVTRHVPELIGHQVADLLQKQTYS